MSIIKFIILFMCIYNIDFIFINLKFIFLIISCIYIIKSLLKSSKIYIEKILIHAYAFQLIHTMGIITITRSFDITMLRIIMGNISNLIIFYWIFNKILLKDKKENIIKYLVILGTVQSICGLLIYFIPEIKNVLIKILVMDEISKIKFINQTRIYGFGIKNFGAGIIQGYYILFLSFLLNKKNYKLILSLIIFNSFVSMLMSRTSIVGILLCILVIFVKNYKKILQICILSSSLSVLIYYYFKNILSRYFAWGFGFLLGKEDSSLEHMKEMYIFPDSYKTLILGDGYLIDYVSNSYYMNTDIGYSRILFYSGIFGIFVYFISPLVITIIILLKSKNKEIRVFSFFSFFYLIILNLKGIADIDFLLMILYFYSKKITLEKNVDK